MGYADRVPNIVVMSKHHWTPRVVPILGSTDRHLAVAVLARSRCARRLCCRWRANSGWLRSPVGLAGHHYGPSDAGHLVGQRDGRHLLRLARQQASQPWRGTVLLDGLLDHRRGAEYDQPAKPLVALAADLAEPLFAAGRVLARRDANPRRKMPGRAEHRRIGHLEGKADGADRPDAGDRGQALAGLILAMPGYQPRFDRLQLGGYGVELRRHNVDHLARQRRHPRIIGQALQQLDELLGPFAAVTPNS